MKWTFEKLNTDAAKYTHRAAWKRASPAAYTAARRMKVLPQVTMHMQRPTTRPPKWTKEAVLIEALKYPNVTAWLANSGGSYHAARELGISKQCKAHMSRKKYWTEDRVLDDVRQYASYTDWVNKSPVGYSMARYLGIVQKCQAILPKIKTSHTLEDIRTIANRFQAASDWKEADPTSYRYAAMNGWLPMLTSRFDSRQSKPERDLLRWTRQHYTSARPRRFMQPNGKRLTVDIYVPDRNVVIEMNGLYWHSEDPLSSRLFDTEFDTLSSMEKKHVYNFHIKRTEFLKTHSIQLIHIWEHEWLERQEQVKNFLYSKLGLAKSIGARKCEFRPISNPEARAFCEANHIQGAPNIIELALGAFYEGELIMVTTWSPHHRQRHAEKILSRMCGKFGYHVAGGLSKMTKMAHEALKCPLKTWVHLTLSDGSSYVKAGWTIVDKLAPDYFYQKGQKAFSKQSFKKDCIKRKHPEVYDPSKTEAQMMAEAGYGRVWDCGKITLTYGGKDETKP